MDKKTLVIGASTNPDRFSYKAVKLLLSYSVPTIPMGIKKGKINGIKIMNELLPLEGIHTVTLYIGPQRQAAYFDYILSLNPKRVIFNPGTENPEFFKLLKDNHIESVVHCTLVMLNEGIF